jgi:hypothetical protein
MPHEAVSLSRESRLPYHPYVKADPLIEAAHPPIRPIGRRFDKIGWNDLESPTRKGTRP